jgi:hypothetical protein
MVGNIPEIVSLSEDATGVSSRERTVNKISRRQLMVEPHGQPLPKGVSVSFSIA